jgi:hypothetical protein
MATATATVRKMYIDGKWVEAQNGQTPGVINPATERRSSAPGSRGRNR